MQQLVKLAVLNVVLLQLGEEQHDGSALCN